MNADNLTTIPCIVCGGPPVGMGLFQPTEQWQSERGLDLKEIPYTVCEKHCDLTDKRVIETVEVARVSLSHP